MIYLFKNEHKWLSNFEPCEIELHGITYQSVESAYQSEKSNDEKWKTFCKDNSSRDVKIASKKIKLRNDWDSVKLRIMEHLLIQKFSKEPFKTLLLETGDENIVEGNWWGDVEWGVDLTRSPNIGENHLGRLIMKIRENLKQE